MKIAVFSDSHGNSENMRTAVETLRPDIIFHLGDGFNDAEELKKLYPDLSMYRVLGNNDGFVPGVEKELRMELCGKKFRLCHGHTYGVRSGTERLKAAALGEDVILYGHTHRAWAEQSGSTLLLNPGCVSGRGETTCAAIEIDGNTLEYCHLLLEGGEWIELR